MTEEEFDREQVLAFKRVGGILRTALAPPDDDEGLEDATWRLMLHLSREPYDPVATRTREPERSPG